MKALMAILRIVIIAFRFRHAGLWTALCMAVQTYSYRRCGLVLDVMKPEVIHGDMDQDAVIVPFALLPAPKDEEASKS